MIAVCSFSLCALVVVLVHMFSCIHKSGLQKMQEFYQNFHPRVVNLKFPFSFEEISHSFLNVFLYFKGRNFPPNGKVSQE